MEEIYNQAKEVLQKGGKDSFYFLICGKKGSDNGIIGLEGSGEEVCVALCAGMSESEVIKNIVMAACVAILKEDEDLKEEFLENLNEK